MQHFWKANKQTNKQTNNNNNKTVNQNKLRLQITEEERKTGLSASMANINLTQCLRLDKLWRNTALLLGSLPTSNRMKSITIRTDISPHFHCPLSAIPSATAVPSFSFSSSPWYVLRSLLGVKNQLSIYLSSSWRLSSSFPSSSSSVFFLII